MKINRTMTIETNEIQIGDLDQYLDKAMQMNKRSTSKGGYQESDLREELNSEKILKDFTGLELAPFDNGDLLRLPFYGEMFGHDDWYNSGAVEPDDCERWPLMKERANRVAERKGESYEWGWLQNKYVRSATNFCLVDYGGTASGWVASHSVGVRPAFLIKLS